MRYTEKTIIIILLFVFVISVNVSARWLSVDPKADKYPSTSPYAYAMNNPLKYIDPNGKETQVFSIPVVLGTKHLFLRVKNDNLNVNTSLGYYPISRVDAVLNMFRSESNVLGDIVILKII